MEKVLFQKVEEKVLEKIQQVVERLQFLRLVEKFQFLKMVEKL
jgi:hypothetical protein